MGRQYRFLPTAAATPSKASKQTMLRGRLFVQSVGSRAKCVSTAKRPMSLICASRTLHVCWSASQGAASGDSPATGAGAGAGLDVATDNVKTNTKALPWGWIFTTALWAALVLTAQAADGRPAATLLQSPPAAALLQAGAAFASTAVACQLLLPALRHLRALQVVREDGPKSHTQGQKTRTPTMGGLAFVPVALATALWFARGDPTVGAVCAATAGFMLIGLWDDVAKVRGQSSAGLSPRGKLIAQGAVAAALCAWLAHGPTSSAVILPPTSVALPFNLPNIPLGGAFWALSAFAMVAESNATNLTDGLDGLAASTGAVAAATMGVVALTPAIMRPEIAAFCFCVSGASAGFLTVNRHPAACFMGDTGSLAIGGALGAAAAAMGGAATLPLLIATAVFAAEATSVLAQVSYFKWTKRRFGEGRRLLRMAPLHHHLELGGWSEVHVVAALTMAGAIVAVAAVAIVRCGL